jgi:uncharacterized repeat protein (TIGR03803 family)
MRPLVSEGSLTKSLLEEWIMKKTPQYRNWISRMLLPVASAALALAAMLLPAVITTQSAQAQTFTTLHSFDGTDGENPYYAGLVQATNGNLYGTTYGGGANGYGTVYKITPGGTLTTVYNFCSQSGCVDGASPAAGLILATNGNFYGTTHSGGVTGVGTVFKITPSGTLTTLYSFCPQGAGCTDGQDPITGLIQATDGNFYGVTGYGGAYTLGSVFKITPSGTLTTLYSFCSGGVDNCTDGDLPFAALVQATNGNLYGAASGGGADNNGTIFEITTSGALTTIHSFDSTDGSGPLAALVQATDGNLYGTTVEGGATDVGTVFKITPSGTLTTLYNFCSLSGCADGENPSAALVQATNGRFYGTTATYGTLFEGTIFEITSTGTLTTLYNFCCMNGANPYAALVQDTNGRFYGTTNREGLGVCPSGCGTVFGLSVGLGPFVETLPASGRVGAAVKILGTSLTGATSVTFNGTAATFTVVSSSEITTTVPAGATSGKVKVVTSSGTLTSNVKFRVTP